MQTINSTHGVHVHADLNELDRIRHQLTASQLALWGDHSSRIAQMFGLNNNDIADVIFNDCGLVVWAVANPELGAAIALGLTAVWSQIANLNALCDLVESKYQVGELTIDRKMALEHQMLEVAATAPFFAKLGLGGPDKSDEPKSGDSGAPAKHPVKAPTVDLPPVPVSGPASGGLPTDPASPGKPGLVANAVDAAGSSHRLELQDSEDPKGASGYKGSYAQN